MNVLPRASGFATVCHGKSTAHGNRHETGLVPVDLVIASNKGRIPELIPIRYGRMSVSPFTFYRGTALNMASDLATTPNTGVLTHLCGDCHLMNFGGFATPERRWIFDINDFDETLHGPWEWDLKRLAASFVLAARSNGFAAADQRSAAMACARSYRERIRAYAKMAALDVWYARVDKKAAPGLDVRLGYGSATAQAHRERRNPQTVVETDFPKMVESSGGKFVIKDNPPLIYHDQAINLESERDNILTALGQYRMSLQDDRKVLFDRYRLADIAVKVVGVGSVGTFCAVLLMMAEDDDPLLLQVKEARASVLGAVSRQEPLRQPRAARRGGAAPDAVGERHLPGLGGGQARTAFLCAPVARHEVEAAGRNLRSNDDAGLRRAVRLDARTRACTLRATRR